MTQLVSLAESAEGGDGFLVQDNASRDIISAQKIRKCDEPAVFLSTVFLGTEKLNKL